MIVHQNVVRFLQAALECSVYLKPIDPGLTMDELAEAARRAGFLDGEINDSIPQVATQYFGGRGDRKIWLNANQSLLLTLFHMKEEPDYRNIEAFQSIFSTMRTALREKGLANASIERPSLIERSVGKNVSERNLQITIAILIANDILLDKNGFISFVSGKGTYGSPGDPGNMRLRQGTPVRKEERGRAYAIVESLIAERNNLVPAAPPGPPAKSTTATSSQLSNNEWLIASAALDLLGLNYSSETHAICKRAYAGLIKARAKRVISDSQTLDDFVVPQRFWWAEGEPALKQDWITGDFDTWIDRKHHLRAFGVEFLRSDIESMRTTSREGLNVRTRKSLSGMGDRRSGEN